MRAGVPRHVATSSRNVPPPGVASGHPATTEAGLRVLALGGTAGDAAVAAVFAACVAETIFTGLGGGGFATYYEAATGRVSCLDFFCATPGLDADLKAGPMTPIAVRFGEVPIPYQIGGASVAVPGVPAGCGEIHRRWGRLPWSEVVAPAMELAAAGVPMPEAHVRTLPALQEAMLHDQGIAAYSPQGRLLEPGATLKHEGLAHALGLIAAEGPQVCYTGEIGERIVETVRADRGGLGPKDLARYQVLDCEIKTADLAGCTVFGRADLNQALASISALPRDLTSLSRGEVVVAMARALGADLPEGIGDTTNVTVVDPAGNACVVTTTLGLGAGRWLPGLGIHLNSMLGEGELNIGELQPGDRILSMMCPMVALDPDGALRLAAGSAGASRIRSALLATLVGTLVEGRSTADAIAAPRMHPVGRVAHVEPDYPADEAEALTDAGYLVNRWEEFSHYFGGVSAIGVGGPGADPRRGGVAARFTA